MFIFNLSDLVYLCNNENLLFTSNLVKIKANKKAFKKTIIEIILDIYIKILFNHKLQKSHKLIYISLNSIFDNIAIGNNNYTICYYNDYLNNLLTKKKKTKEEQIIVDKINKVNEILNEENNDKFEVCFITFFLLKLAAYFENKILKKDNSLKNYLEKYIKKLVQEHKDLYKLNKNSFSKTSKNFYYNHLKDKIESYVISNKSKKNLDIPPEIKIFFQQKLSNFNSHVSEEFTSGNCNTKNNIVDKRNKSLTDENEPNKGLRFSKKISSSLASVNKSPVLSNRNESLIYSPSLVFNDKNLNYFKSNSPTNAASSKVKRKLLYVESNIIEDDLDNNLKLKEKPEEDKNEIIENININIESNTIINIDMDLPNKHLSNIKKINLSDYVNSIFYFENIDSNYISNYKKYLMNNIFSLFFLDVFYNNELFKKMKSFYLNEYEASKYDTKMLNYPSKYKNFNNGLEPGMFLKMHNNFFSNKFFHISHPYFIEYIKKNNIINRSIKLVPKRLPEYLNNKNKAVTINIYCELIKIDRAYFGQIIGFNFENQGKLLIFKEEDIDLNIENDKIFDNINNYKYLFSLTCLINSEKGNKNNQKDIKRDERKKNKKKFIIILFSEIEEIIERRFLFMWQGLEIYLKNGKSYFFNLFSESTKNNIFDYFKTDEKIKNLIRSRDFLYKEKEITRKWAKYYLQNYEYLLLVNKYGSRTFNDNNQYPVFPWLLIKNYENIEKINGINVTENLVEKFFNNKEENANIDDKSKDLLKSLRKMKYPICIQTEEKIKKVIEKYIEEDEKFKYHLGIHYSTSYYIYYYLMRQQPYSDLLILLQNYQQESPNRMFIGLNESISLLEKSKDPREIIPELFTRFEYLLNLNCNFFGYRNDNTIVDDNLIVNFNNNNENNPLYKYINFIIEHRKLLDSKLISITINDWIDNIFGINQLPQNKKSRENSCNIFLKTSYEQEINLLKKLDKYIEKIKNNEENKKKLLKKLITKITSILDFGQTPYQIFKEKHRKRKINVLNIVENKGEIEEKQKEKEKEDDLNSFATGGFESVFKNLDSKNIIYEIKNKYNYIYFEINPILNKIFMLSKERNIEIISTKLYNSKSEEQYFFSLFDNIQFPYFLFNDNINIGFDYQYYIYNIKYAFSAFDDIEEKPYYKNIDTKELYHTYGREIIDNILLNKEKEKNIDKNNKKNELNENLYYKFISCRYIDKCFKIHIISKNGKSKESYKPISFFCEDFVTSCCTISFCQFLIGLKNGKLIQFYIERQEKNENQKSKENENMELFQIKMEKYIQGHNGKINVIEINKKLGIIITCGDDNYILIRKLYDFELLSPIKIKNKFIITMAKISPLNFLYIICFNKEKKVSVIFGYTLTGLKFAKSEYSFYDNIDFTLNGNIVTFKNHSELSILSGSDLNSIKMNKNDSNYEDFMIKKAKVKDSIYLRYNYVIRKNDTENNYNKIITYYKIDGKKILQTLDVSQNKYFD